MAVTRRSLGPSLVELAEEHPEWAERWLGEVKSNNPDTPAGHILNDIIDEVSKRRPRCPD